MKSLLFAKRHSLKFFIRLWLANILKSLGRWCNNASLLLGFAITKPLSRIKHHVIMTIETPKTNPPTIAFCTDAIAVLLGASLEQ